MLDHLNVCQGMLQMIEKMKIDEAGIYSLTKFSSKKGVKCVKDSDHRTLIAHLDVNWLPNRSHLKERIEIYNYKDNKSFEQFQLMTSDNEQLESCFDDEKEDLEVSSSKWLKMLKNIIKVSFKKI